MNTLPGETTLLESELGSGDQRLILTTHRVRYDEQLVGTGMITSIMLEEVASCAMVRRSYPMLFGIAVLCIALGFTLGIGFFGIFVALMLVGLYFYTKSQRLEFGSAGATISVNITWMTIESLRAFIDETEKAKDARFQRR